MAKNDIRVWKHPATPMVAHFPIAAAATCVAGEPVRLNTAGELVEATTDPATGNDFLGYLTVSGDTVGATDANGTFRNLVGAFTPGTGFPVSGDLVSVVIPNSSTHFITANFDATTAGFGDVPAKTDVGDGAGLQLVSGSWGIAKGGAQNVRILQVLDSAYQDIAFSAGAGVYCVFVHTSGQTMAEAVNTDADA
jgi:hypothetical protein